MKTPEELATDWCWENLSDSPPVVMLTNPPLHLPHPKEAFIAGYQAAIQSSAQTDTNSVDTGHTINTWNSVDEKMPNRSAQYLVHIENGPTRYTEALHWHQYHENWSGLTFGHKVTHWMELPEPPKK